MTKLSNVKGRITYISSHAKQENLYAVYETTERKFWRELAKCNQEEFAKSGTEGKCIEARELIIALPESFTEYQPDRLLQLFTNHFKQNYGAECIAALHHNKRKTNYHIHLIFAERKLLDEPIIKIASRNMFYDEHGKHVRTKKEILGEDGEIREGCHIVKKGEVYEKKLFTAKDERFKSNSFLDEVKHMMYDTSVTIVILSPNMKESKWIDWEIEYCLKDITRKDRTSHTNGVVAVIMKVDNSYEWFKKSGTNCHGSSTVSYELDKVFDIISQNHFNSNPEQWHCDKCKTYDWLNGSYITFVEEETFMDDPEKYINNAYDKSENDASGYDLVKQR